MSGDDFPAFGQHDHFDDLERSFPLSKDYVHVTQQDHDGDTQVLDIDLDSPLAYYSMTFEDLRPRSIPTPYTTDFSHFSETEAGVPSASVAQYTSSSQVEDSWTTDFADHVQFSNSTPAWTSLQATGTLHNSLRGSTSYSEQQSHTHLFQSSHSNIGDAGALPHLTEHIEDPFLDLRSIQDPALYLKTVHHPPPSKSDPTVPPSEPDDLMSQPPNRDQTSTSSLQCTDCDYTATSPSNLRKHRAGHDKACLCTVQECEHAQPGNGFCNTNDLERHLFTKHAIGEKDIYLCRFEGCESCVTRKDNFRDHLKRCHSVKDDLEAFCEDSTISPGDERYVAAIRRIQSRAGEQKSKPTASSSRVSKPSITKRAPSRRSKLSKVDHDEAKIETEAEGELALSSVVPIGLPEASQQRQALQLAGEQFAGQISGSRNLQQPFHHGVQQQDWSPAASNPYLNIAHPDAQHSISHLDQHPAYSQRTFMNARGRFSGGPETGYRQQQMQPQSSYMAPNYTSTSTRRVSAPAIRYHPGVGSFHEPLPQNIRSDNLLQDVSTILKDHDLLKSFRHSPELQHVPHWPQHAMTVPTDFLEKDDATEVSPQDEVRTHVGHLEETGLEGRACRCPFCSKTFPIESALTKHLKRHRRPWICMWDDCRHNKLSGQAHLYTANDLGWACQGSKFDQARHEKKVHVEKGQAMACFRCTGHDDHGKPCHQLFSSANFNEYLDHLLACGMSPSDAQRAADAAFIPANFMGRYWCGFCDAVIPNRPIDVLQRDDVRCNGRDTTESLTEEKKLELCLDERRQHIMNHILNGDMKGREGSWRYLNGEGGTKFDLDTERGVDENGKGKGKGKARASARK